MVLSHGVFEGGRARPGRLRLSGEKPTLLYFTLRTYLMQASNNMTLHYYDITVLKGLLSNFPHLRQRIAFGLQHVR